MHQTVIENLSHSYINRDNIVDVINCFSLIVHENETVAILGPSGCGKSTILRCIAGFLKPSGGNISVSGKLPLEAIKNKCIGFAFQESALLPRFTVAENIMLPGSIGLRTISENDLVKRTKELIALMGLVGFENFYPSQLSGGMKQRVALARALLLQPTLLLLDEPLASLDLLTRSNLIVELSKIFSILKTPCIIVTHSIEEAVFLADKIIILSSRPCKIIAEIIPNISSDKKEFGMFDRPEFISKVAECRKVLMENWRKNEN